MKKQEYKFTLGNGSEQEVRAESLPAMLANLPMAEKLRLQRRIVEERGRSKKVVEEEPVKLIEPPTPPAQTQAEATDPIVEKVWPTSEQIARFENLLMKGRELDEQIKALEEEIQNDLNNTEIKSEEPKVETTEEAVVVVNDPAPEGPEKITQDSKEQFIIDLMTEKSEVVISELERINRTDHKLYEEAVQKLIQNEVTEWRDQAILLKKAGKEDAIPLFVQKYEDKIDELLKKAKGELTSWAKEDLEKLKNQRDEIIKNKENRVEVGKIETWFSSASGNKILESSTSNDGGVNTSWGIEHLFEDRYIISKVSPKNEVGMTLRRESIIKPLFDETNLPDGGKTKIIIEKPVVLKKNADGSFDIVEKGVLHYELPSGGGEPTSKDTGVKIETPKTAEEYRKALMENENFFHKEDRSRSAKLSGDDFSKFKSLSKQEAIEEMVKSFGMMAEDLEIVDKGAIKLISKDAVINTKKITPIDYENLPSKT